MEYGSQKKFFCRNVCRTKGLDLKSSKIKKNFRRKSFPANLLPGKVPNLDGFAAYKFDARMLTSRFSLSELSKKSSQ